MYLKNDDDGMTLYRPALPVAEWLLLFGGQYQSWTKLKIRTTSLVNQHQANRSSPSPMTGEEVVRILSDTEVMEWRDQRERGTKVQTNLSDHISDSYTYGTGLCLVPFLGE